MPQEEMGLLRVQLKKDLISIHESCYEETFAIDTLKRVHETYFAI